MSGESEGTVEDAVRDTYRATLPEIYGYLLRRVGGNRAEAEELTQETYLAYVAAIRQGNVIDRPAAWLQTVARNKLVDHIRRRRRRERPLPVEPDDPVLIVSRYEAEALLHNLPSDQRIAVILRYLDGLSVADVAQIFDRSVDATESLLARARRSLSRDLSGVST